MILREGKKNLREKAQALGYGPEVSLMVMRDKPEKSRRTTFLHTRGDFLRPDKKTGPLQPDVPDVFPGLEDSRPGQNRNRLDLAKWLVSSEHPLTARVTVNRIWMRYFWKRNCRNGK